MSVTADSAVVAGGDRAAPVRLDLALIWAARRLAEAGVDQPGGDARMLLRAATGLGIEDMLREPATDLAEAWCRALEQLVGRRCRREPMAQILGRREFWSLEFQITADTLDPRPDSETVVAAALDLARGQAVSRILDLGTGSGCLLLALLSERADAFGVGVDRSARAIAVARANARRLGLLPRARFLVGDWTSAVAGRFDLIVANPPYIADREFATLAPEVSRFEPRMALAGGPDGLDAYRRLIPSLPDLAAPGAVVALEVGAGQAAAVKAMLARAGLHSLASGRDLAGVERCILGRAW